MQKISTMLYKYFVKIISYFSHFSENNNDITLNEPLPLFSKWHQISSNTGPSNTDTNLPNVTICVVVLNSEKWLDAFLKSVLSLDYPKGKISIHFVDHGSTDSTLVRLKHIISEQGLHFKSFRLDERPNYGYGTGNDFAIINSKDEFVLVTNVDIEFYKDSLKKIINVAIHDEESVASWEFRQTPFEHPKYYDPITQLCGWSTHACILIRKLAYFKVGGYDKSIFMYGEDVELSYRFRLNGWKLRYVPTAVIKHYVELNSPSTRPYQLSGSIAANILLRRRYGSTFDRIIGRFFFLYHRFRSKGTGHEEAFEDAIKIYQKSRLKFNPVVKINPNVRFQFNWFNYSPRRLGKAIPLTPFSSQKILGLPIVRIFTHFKPPLNEAFKETIISVLNQTYDNIEHVIIFDSEDDQNEFFKKLKCVYGRKISYTTTLQVFFPSNDNNIKYVCWLDGETFLFSDHIETLTMALEQERSSLMAQSFSWDAMKNNKPSTSILFERNWFENHFKSHDLQTIKHEISNLSANYPEEGLILQKTTSVIRAKP
jgi:GT2 family glycosyltransferase